MDFSGKGQPITESDLRQALVALGLDEQADMAVLWAVLTVESRGFGFLVDKRPKILFERHIFFRETGGRFVSEAPDICTRSGGGYVGGTGEYERLTRALALCQREGLGNEPALRSASWGLGQVMGFNALAAGFKSVTDMVTRMSATEAAQLVGMIGLMRSEGLDAKLRSRDWAGFAKRYNGASYWQNQYDVKLKAAFDKFSSGIQRDLKVRTAQAALLFLTYNPGDPDGVAGQNTRFAVEKFKEANGLGHSDVLDDETYQLLMKQAGLD